MEIGRIEGDFYATMLLREVVLWFWRTVGGLVFLSLLQLLHTQKEFLSLGLYLEAAGFVFTYFGAHLFIKKIRNI